MRRWFSSAASAQSVLPPLSSRPTVLIVRKPRDPAALRHAINIAKWIAKEHPGTQLLAEDPKVPRASAVTSAVCPPQQRPEENHDDVWELAGLCDLVAPGDIGNISKEINLVIGLGGDGTMLHISSLFQGPVPPVASFSLGTLNFLPPFRISEHKSILNRIYDGPITLSNRERLVCQVANDSDTEAIYSKVQDSPESMLEHLRSISGAQRFQVMNEVLVHRAGHPSLATIECRVNGQVMTEAVVDGLIIATPTGSTAYSLSAGGPIIHPTVPGILLTPVCPLSLSFRPVFFPQTSLISMRPAQRARCLPLELMVDGKYRGTLAARDNVVHIHGYGDPVPVITPDATRLEGKDRWVTNINQRLRWNMSFADPARSGGQRADDEGHE
ncbi:ATP-NAD kinase-like domain-containing protein [Catenaria anguillulae PL171]|uniref:ATP-NAD kinase-like domain-containing protein n=1 Tax=Catenaria anguillulae PL171 TaxID=765915 RepID=A0A1Y2HIE3_9FUNG|nr:ATP-NAD kinase-like domain-containing protein [Catenaria anguillulae PL171]